MGNSFLKAIHPKCLKYYCLLWFKSEHLNWKLQLYRRLHSTINAELSTIVEGRILSLTQTLVTWKI